MTRVRPGVFESDDLDEDQSRENAVSDFFEWDAAKYSLEIPAMDEEHLQIIAGMNRLHVLYESKATSAQLAKAMAELLRITEKPFADEEAYMARLGFPDARKHAFIHKQLIERLKQFGQEFHSTGRLTDDLFVFLKMWLKSHICGIDTKYARFGRVA